VINQINGISNTIATAVEEQNATTNEMARNVSEAAHGSGEITSNIAGVAEAAESTSRGATDTQKARSNWWRPRPNSAAWSSNSQGKPGRHGCAAFPSDRERQGTATGSELYPGQGSTSHSRRNRTGPLEGSEASVQRSLERHW
jgi:hypothetical protein